MMKSIKRTEWFFLYGKDVFLFDSVFMCKGMVLKKKITSYCSIVTTVATFFFLFIYDEQSSLQG